jgi:hypothetical protein
MGKLQSNQIVIPSTSQLTPPHAERTISVHVLIPYQHHSAHVTDASRPPSFQDHPKRMMIMA